MTTTTTRTPVEQAAFRGNQRIHIGLAVSDLSAARRFYTTLLGAEPVKERPDYLKFEPADPSINLSLSQVPAGRRSGESGTHYGVQVKSTAAVQAARQRLEAAGFETVSEESSTCCYAVQDKVWARDPDGRQWEVFVVLADAPERVARDTSCCAPAGEASACC